MLKVDDTAEVICGQAHGFKVGTLVRIMDISHSGHYFCRAHGIEQVLRHGQVRLHVDKVLTLKPEAAKPVSGGTGQIEISEEMEIANNLGAIYGVWSQGVLVDILDTRDEAREVKANLGGKACGAFIIQYAPVKEVR